MTVFWDGQLSSNMSIGLNWSADAVPSVVEDVVINNAATTQPVLGSGSVMTVASMTVSAGRLTINGDLTLFGGLTLSGQGQVSIGTGAQLSGNLNALNALGKFTNNGTINGNVTFNAAGTTFVNAGVVFGTITYNGSGVFEGTDSAAVTVIGAEGTQTFVADLAPFAGALVVDVSDGGGGRNIGNGIKLSLFEQLSMAGGLAGDRLVGAALSDLLIGNGGNDSLFGNADDDDLIGGSGQDSLDGGAGADKMDGGSGDDQYFVDDSGDTVTDISGQDTVSVNLGRFVLTGSGVETMIYLGEDKFTGIGNELANVIIGGNLNDVLDGKGGADQMVGLNGNDRYVISSDLDVVEEEAFGGIDTVQRGNAGINLSAYANVENAVLTGTGAFDLLGDKTANRLTGNSGANVITGDGGADVLLGGAGADVFRFVSLADSTAAASDRILDFTPDEDRIDLLQIDARPTDTRNNAFDWIGEQAFSGKGVESEGQVRFGFRGPLTVVQCDVDGNGKADLVILLTGEFLLSDADFIL